MYMICMAWAFTATGIELRSKVAKTEIDQQALVFFRDIVATQHSEQGAQGSFGLQFGKACTTLWM